jgi:hypothetical protein
MKTPRGIYWYVFKLLHGATGISKNVKAGTLNLFYLQAIAFGYRFKKFFTSLPF